MWLAKRLVARAVRPSSPAKVANGIISSTHTVNVSNAPMSGPDRSSWVLLGPSELSLRLDPSTVCCLGRHSRGQRSEVGVGVNPDPGIRGPGCQGQGSNAPGAATNCNLERNLPRSVQRNMICRVRSRSVGLVRVLRVLQSVGVSFRVPCGWVVLRDGSRWSRWPSAR